MLESIETLSAIILNCVIIWFLVLIYAPLVRKLNNNIATGSHNAAQRDSELGNVSKPNKRINAEVGEVPPEAILSQFTIPQSAAQIGTKVVTEEATNN